MPGHPLDARACYTNHRNSFVPTFGWRSLRPLRFNGFFRFMITVYYDFALRHFVLLVS